MLNKGSEMGGLVKKIIKAIYKEDYTIMATHTSFPGKKVQQVLE